MTGPFWPRSLPDWCEHEDAIDISEAMILYDDHGPIVVKRKGERLSGLEDRLLNSVGCCFAGVDDLSEEQKVAATLMWFSQAMVVSYVPISEAIRAFWRIKQFRQAFGGDLWPEKIEDFDGVSRRKAQEQTE